MWFTACSIFLSTACILVIKYINHCRQQFTGGKAQAASAPLWNGAGVASTGHSHLSADKISLTKFPPSCLKHLPTLLVNAS